MHHAFSPSSLLLMCAAILSSHFDNGLHASDVRQQPCRQTNKQVECTGVTKVPERVPRNVTVLKLSHCDLTEIPSNALASLDQLTRFNLHNCTVKVIKSCAFYDLTLTKIVFTKSHIDTVEPYAFSNLTGISLAFEDTYFREIAPLSFSHIDDMITIDIQRANIERFHTKAFNDVTGGQTIIARSFIQFLYPNALSSFNFRSMTVLAIAVTETCSLKMSLKNSQRAGYFFNNSIQIKNCSQAFSQAHNTWNTSLVCTKPHVSVLMTTLPSTISTLDIKDKYENVTSTMGVKLSSAGNQTKQTGLDTSYNDTILEMNSTREPHSTTMDEVINAATEILPNFTANSIMSSTTGPNLNSTHEMLTNNTSEIPENTDIVINSTTEIMQNFTMDIITDLTAGPAVNSTQGMLMNQTEILLNFTASSTVGKKPMYLFPCLEILNTSPDLQSTNGEPTRAHPLAKGATFTAGLLCAIYTHLTAVL